ncbi:response regulator receiver protein [Methylobacterium aquaticum]|uniref:response regulator receiver protein n=1 Tax=Methylobacterium aquaticum TaxID=270351 RepID=UPI003D177216
MNAAVDPRLIGASPAAEGPGDAAPRRPGARRTITVDTRSGVVSVGAQSARVSPLGAKLLAILIQVSPEPVRRDRVIALLFKGRRTADREGYFRRILHETRAKLAPLGATILYVPNPGGSDLPGHLSLAETARREGDR